MKTLVTKLAILSLRHPFPVERIILLIALFLPPREFRLFEALRFALKFGV
jgi:hypothetical protein